MTQMASIVVWAHPLGLRCGSGHGSDSGGRSSGGGASKAECEKLVAGRSRVAGISLLTRTRTRVTCTREPTRVGKPVQIPMKGHVCIY